MTAARPLAVPLRALQRIGVFRALNLGDMLCAGPALQAIHAACPEARITLIGLRWAEAWAARMPFVHDFIAFPGWEGLPESVPDLAAREPFLAEMCSRRFDLLLQLHGSGSIVNTMLERCGASRLAAFVPDAGEAGPDRVAWPQHGREIDRLLALVQALGMAPVSRALLHPVTVEDRLALHDRWPQLRRPYACVHPGAQLASRRWPARRFAQVADRLAEAGLQVVLTGSATERPLVEQVRRLMHVPAIDTAGSTTLWTLGALLERAALLVCNDTGVSHVAAALGTPSVVISSGGDAARWSPCDCRRHRVLWAALSCRPCAHACCPTQHECAEAIGVEAVWDEVRSLLATRPAPAASPTGVEVV